MTKTEAEAAVKKYGSTFAAARELNVSNNKLRRLLGKLQDAPKTATPATVRVGRSLSEFRNTYDKSTIVPQRIKAGLRALGHGWDYEVGFAKTAGVSLADLGNFREAFAEHVIQIGRDGRRAWAGTKSAAEQMRRML